MKLSRKKPTTYRKWLRERYKVKELGAKAFMTDSMAKLNDSRYEIAQMIANTLSKSFATTILQSGYSLPLNVHYKRERDASLRGFEHVIVTEHYMELLPEQYMFMAFDAWNKTYGDLVVWEKKTLWQYIKFWWSRTWQSRKDKVIKWR